MRTVGDRLAVLEGVDHFPDVVCRTTSWPRSDQNCRCADRVKRSEFHRAVDDEFGARAATAHVADLVLPPFGRDGVVEALDVGIAPRDIWQALCDETDVPDQRRHGAGRREPKRR